MRSRPDCILCLPVRFLSFLGWRVEFFFGQNPSCWDCCIKGKQNSTDYTQTPQLWSLNRQVCTTAVIWFPHLLLGFTPQMSAAVRPGQSLELQPVLPHVSKNPRRKAVTSPIPSPPQNAASSRELGRKQRKGGTLPQGLRRRTGEHPESVQ